MRRLLLLLVLLLPGMAKAQFAPQIWDADQDGANHLCYDVASFQANNLAGGGTQCVEADNTGLLFPVSCSAIGGVSSVTGTAQRVSATPTTGAVVVDTIGGFYSGATSGGNQDLGALSSGVLELTQSGGLAAMSTYACGANDLARGSGSSGQLTCNGDFTVDDTNGFIVENIAGGSGAGAGFKAYNTYPFGYADLWFVNDLGQFNRAEFYYTGSGYPGAETFPNSWTVSTAGGPASYIVMLPNNVQAFVLKPTEADFPVGLLSLGASAAPSTPASGQGRIYVDSTSKNIAVKSDAGTVNHGVQTHSCAGSQWLTAITDTGTSTCAQPSFGNISGSATCGQLPALTGDVTSSAGSCGTTLVNIPNDTTAAGDILFTAVASPSTPAAGKARIYVDSGTKNIAVKDDSGTVNHGIRTNTCAASRFFTAVGGDGASTCSTVAFGDLTGSATCGQLPALTGDVTSSAGSCGTTLVNIPNDTTAAGDILFTAVASPSTPAAGKARIYVDSTSKNIAVKADSGVVNHGAQTLAASGAVVVQGLADNGSWSTLDLSVNYPKFTISYYLNGMTAATLFTGAWIQFGTTVTESTLHIESVVPFAAAGIRIIANVLLNSISSGLTTLTMTRNGGAPSSGGSVTFSAGATGIVDSGYQGGIVSSAGDAWGLIGIDNAGLATGSLTAVVTIYVY